MTSLRNFIAALAVSLPLVATAQQPAPAAPAAAAPAKPPFTIYGTLNVNAQWTMAKGATAPGNSVQSRNAVSVDSSNIGIRGAHDIATGYQLTFQCETSANLDVGGVGLCNRNSRIGVAGFWGTLFLGNWDTPYKAATYGTKADDPFGNTDVFGYQGIMGSPGFNTASGTWSGAAGVRGFDLRANNSIAYWSPKFMGASLKVQYSTDEQKGVRAGGVGYVSDPRLYSAVVNYDFGPFSFVGAVERHDDGNGLQNIGGPAFGAPAFIAAQTVRGSQDNAVKLAAGFELPTPVGAVTLSAMAERLMYSQKFIQGAAGGQIRKYERDAAHLGAKLRMADHEFRARYSYADAGDCTTLSSGTCNDQGLGAQMMTVGYAYHFTKAAQGYLFYTRIENERRAAYVFTVGGVPAVVANLPAGADPQAAGAGLRYAF